MNLLLVDDEIAMLHIMEKAIDWKKKGIQKLIHSHIQPLKMVYGKLDKIKRGL